MAKLKNIIKQLSEKDVESIYHSLIEHNAEKSAFLLRSMRKKDQSDETIMEELDVNTNAYYTLRSRLNQKIEEYLLEQMESPRTDILKKVASINEILFTKKKTLAIATLKKMEKELLDYDLSNELTIVYKSLKKLHLDTPDYFNYSQLYNKHVAYMLALDKAEILLGEYFSKYGEYYLNGNPTGKLELSLLAKEIKNIARLYDSHRLYIYQNCLIVFHRLYVESESEHINLDEEALEDIFDKAEKIFQSYKLDSIYHHLNLVFEFLKFEYYNKYNLHRKAENYYDEVNEALGTLFSNYSLYTFPPALLTTKLRRALRLGSTEELYPEAESLFLDFDEDSMDQKSLTIYYTYRAITCFYAGKYQEAATWLNDLLNRVSFKKYTLAQMEVKSLLALQYCLLNEYDLFNQLTNSIQRNIRIIGKENCESIYVFIKILKTAISENKRDKEVKIKDLYKRIPTYNDDLFRPTLLVKFDDLLIKDMVSVT